jgi:hypothetical protein
MENVFLCHARETIVARHRTLDAAGYILADGTCVAAGEVGRPLDAAAFRE